MVTNFLEFYNDYVKKVLLKKCLKKYSWYSESAYKSIHNRFRWFMLNHHYNEYKEKRYVIINVSYDGFYSKFLYINYVINGKHYIYQCDLTFLDI